MLFYIRHDLADTLLFLEIHFPIIGIDIYEKKTNIDILDFYCLKLQLITIPITYVHLLHRYIIVNEDGLAQMSLIVEGMKPCHYKHVTIPQILKNRGPY